MFSCISGWGICFDILEKQKHIWRQAEEMAQQRHARHVGVPLWRGNSPMISFDLMTGEVSLMWWGYLQSLQDVNSDLWTIFGPFWLFSGLFSLFFFGNSAFRATAPRCPAYGQNLISNSQTLPNKIYLFITFPVSICLEMSVTLLVGTWLGSLRI